MILSPVAPQDLTATGAAYHAKLRRAGRSRKLAVAYLLLLRALLQLADRIARRPTQVVRVDLLFETHVLSSAVMALVAERLGVQIDPVQQQLQRAVTAAVAKAAHELTTQPQLNLRQALRERFALIAVAETQAATAAAMRSGAQWLTSIRREYTSPNPCDRCYELAGVYHAPYPDDLWATHPNCACVWSRGPDGMIEQ